MRWRGQTPHRAADIMQCTACGRENREGVRFCEECGAAVARRCGACGGDVPPAAKFCGACGASLGVSGVGSRVSRETPMRVDTLHPTPDPLSEARKVVTIVFADLIGSTSLHERLDAEST